MILRTLPEGLIATSALVEGITARLAAAHAAAAPIITAVIPPAIDMVSVTAATGLSAQGVQHSATGATGVTALAESGRAVAESALSYQEGDTSAAGVYAVEVL